MTGTQDMTATYRSWTGTPEAEAAIPKDAWYELRLKSFERFKQLGFPTRKLEAWKYMPLEPILSGMFASSPVSADASEVRAHFGKNEKHRLVFINGVFAPELSMLQTGRFTLAPLAAHLNSGPGARIGEDRDAFSALNSAYFQDGAFLYIPKDTAIEEPIHLLFADFGDSDALSVSYPRIRIVLEDGARAHFVINRLKLSKGCHFTNGVAEMNLGRNAKLTGVNLLRQEEGGFQIFTMHVRQQEGSSFEMNSFSYGGAISRDEVNVDFDGENAFNSLSALAILGDSSQVYSHANVNHRKPYCTSRQVYKNILAGQSVAEYNSVVHVFRDAQHSDTQQLDRNLILSDTARAYSRPQLKIDADDVKCNHGAATGQLEQDELFYLRSRGLKESEARYILTYGFAAEMIQKIQPLVLRQQLEDFAGREIQKLILNKEG